MVKSSTNRGLAASIIPLLSHLWEDPNQNMDDSGLPPIQETSISWNIQNIHGGTQKWMVSNGNDGQSNPKVDDN